MIISKRAVGMGNGAAIYVPKEYAGKELLVTLPEGIEDIKKRVLSGLIQFMPNVLGVYLYGSYARGEEKQSSDIDILVIAEEKDIRIKDLFDDVDIRVLTLEEIRKAIENFPAVTLPILKESKIFLNPLLLEELKNSRINFNKFQWHFQDIRRIIKIVKAFVDMDKEDISPDNVYSLMMRARVCNMMESLIKKEIFSNKSVKKALLDSGLTEDEYEKFYYAYQQIRNNKEAKIKISREEIFKLIKILEDYSKKLEKEVEARD